jgi:hypothetical protein
MVGGGGPPTKRNPVPPGDDREDRWWLPRMCRFVAYRGPPIRLDELIYEPDRSIIQQSIVPPGVGGPSPGTTW